MIKNFINKPIGHYPLIVIVALFMVTFFNFSFFKNTLNVYEFSGLNIVYIFSLYIVLSFFIIFLLSLFASRYTTKPLLISLLVISSFCAYFMDTYNVVIDDSMIQNALQTDFNESLDLLSFSLIFYFLFLALLPSWIIYKLPIKYRPLRQELLEKLIYVLGALLLIVIILFSLSKFYTSFFREHKPLRYYTNPTYWIYGIGKYTALMSQSVPKDMIKIGEDATIREKVDTDTLKKPELVILVVGEATRADRFSLNGYERETNPLLAQENVISFPNFFSCGTSTAHSVPCMFAMYDRKSYSDYKARTTENVLDVLDRVGVNILWRDNNSDSKGVALRVAYEDYRTPANNTICDEECRDEGMLIGLDSYINKHQGENVLIVLHQMGNHGPAYYKRYPKEFEKFTPVCQTNQLEKCSMEEIGNAYDNSVLYTDTFLEKTITLLKNYEETYGTTMIYMSDHGESLGENGLYLHGMPYFMAPDEQKRVASVLWLGESNQKNLQYEKIKAKKDLLFSHDNLFHSLLSVFEVETDVYDKSQDIFYDTK
ncbi:MAG: phosphoethanolamine--lipid A transferase [Sulfurimonadaceae bacterium]|jgi:lipid A ethanolaminephosphotransferase|nr:phosphoethanolamine--lipid A transferase [Sulfurimonadaceae bacterium]